MPHEGRSKFIEHAKGESRDKKEGDGGVCPVPHEGRSKFVEKVKASQGTIMHVYVLYIYMIYI